MIGGISQNEEFTITKKGEVIERKNIRQMKDKTILKEKIDDTMIAGMEKVLTAKKKVSETGQKIKFATESAQEKNKKRVKEIQKKMSAQTKNKQQSSAESKKQVAKKNVVSLDEQLKRAVADYNTEYTHLNNLGMTLFTDRKRSVDLLVHTENLINSIANHPKSFDKEMDEIQINRKQFKETCDFAKKELDVAQKAAVSVGAGVAGGMAVASLAPTAAMWIATTFGTASTGTAISALSGAAAESAALAWLGGGALAAGGGGMVAGQALLALAGPVGWSIMGATLLTSIVLFANKKSKLNREKKEEIASVLKNTETLTEICSELQLLLDKTTTLRNELGKQYEICMNYFSGNFMELSETAQMQLGTLVNNAKSLSVILNKCVEA